MANEKIIVLDFGGQYNRLIARRIRDLGVYSEVLSCETSLEKLKDPLVKGIIFTGGPNSVYDPSSPHISKEIFELGKPILGICYGAQLIAYTLGGTVAPCVSREYGTTATKIIAKSKLFEGIPEEFNAFMSHGDYVYEMPEGFKVTSSSASTPNCSFENEALKVYAVQYHPEVEHTENGNEILSNFIYGICGCSHSWKYDSFIDDTVKAIREQVGDSKVVCALSGGVDSCVTAALLEKAIGDQLTCVFVNHGLLRKYEAKQVNDVFGEGGRFKLHFTYVDASELFLGRLAGVNEPEQKRRIIGSTFIDVFQDTMKGIAEDSFLAQGTIYPDVIESGLGKSAVIKSHHNVGGLPKDLKFKGLVEPLRDLFKDEVRKVGLMLGLPREMVFRQPFPGPGLGVRIVGEVTKEKVRIVQDADYIFRSEMAEKGYEGKAAQFFAALSNMKSVGCKGDARSYDYAIVIRAVTTDDFMTAKPVDLPYSFLSRVADRIVNEVEGVNRVLYDFTSKPPATIELE